MPLTTWRCQQTRMLLLTTSDGQYNQQMLALTDAPNDHDRKQILAPNDVIDGLYYHQMSAPKNGPDEYFNH